MSVIADNRHDRKAFKMARYRTRLAMADKNRRNALMGSRGQAFGHCFFPFAFGPHVAFWGLLRGSTNRVFSHSGWGWDTLQRISSILENKVTVICCTPTYALRMAEIAKEKGINIKESSVRIMVHGGEPGR